MRTKIKSNGMRSAVVSRFKVTRVVTFDLTYSLLGVYPEGGAIHAGLR